MCDDARFTRISIIAGINPFACYKNVVFLPLHVHIFDKSDGTTHVKE